MLKSAGKSNIHSINENQKTLFKDPIGNEIYVFHCHPNFHMLYVFSVSMCANFKY